MKLSGGKSKSAGFRWQQYPQNEHYCYIIRIFSTPFAIACFISTTWKRKQTMEQQQHGACERTKTKQRQSQVTSYWNWARVLFPDLAHKQYNGIIKECLSCLTSESKGRFLIKHVNASLSMMSSHVANPVFFNKKNRLDVQNTF